MVSVITWHLAGPALTLSDLWVSCLTSPISGVYYRTVHATDKLPVPVSDNHYRSGWELSGVGCYLGYTYRTPGYRTTRCSGYQSPQSY